MAANALDALGYLRGRLASQICAKCLSIVGRHGDVHLQTTWQLGLCDQPKLKCMGNKLNLSRES